ncbi:hypothetical protein [Mycolicibacterium phlei]
MTRILAALATAVAVPLLVAAPAGADPEDLLPYCSGDQTPIDTHCRPMAHQEVTHGSGLDPDLPGGLTPSDAPVLGG